MDDLAVYVFSVILIIIVLAAVFAFGHATGEPDIVTLDNRECILVYEANVVRKFCEAK